MVRVGLSPVAPFPAPNFRIADSPPKSADDASPNAFRGQLPDRRSGGIDLSFVRVADSLGIWNAVFWAQPPDGDHPFPNGCRDRAKG